MSSQIPLKWSLSIVGMVGLVFASIIIFFPDLVLFGLVSYAKSTSSVSSQASKNLIDSQSDISFSEQTGSGLPIRLKIPKIHVNIAIEHVGLTPDGAVGVPKSIAKAAWFNLGPRPGDSGSAVITGHYGRWKNGQGSVFDNLYKLRKGDKIYINDEKGMIMTFVVRESRRYNPKADATDVFRSDDGKSHLNLITCEGSWNRISKTYPKRLVIFADKE